MLSQSCCLLPVALCLLTLMPIHAASPNELAKIIQPIVDSHEGVVGVSIKHLPSGESYQHNADRPLPTASLIKLPVLIAMHQAIQAGKLNLDDAIELTAEDKVPGSGVLTDNFSVGTKLTLRDAARLMIVFSDNTATNLVVDRVGLAEVAELMEQMGCPQTKQHAKVFKRETSIFPERSKKFGLGSTTANEMVSLLEKLDAKQVVSAEASQAIIDLLYACDDRTKIPRDLPSEVKVAHKTGAVSNSRTDAGLIDAPTGRIAICILTNENKDRSWSDSNAANVVCGKIAKAAFDYFNPDGVETSGVKELSIGADGEIVEALQRTLNARLEPSPDLGVDGDFGPATERAVLAFQKEHGLPENGVVTADMWGKLGDLLMDAAPVADPKIVNAETPPKTPPLPLSGPPFVTCKAWGIADGETGELLWSENEATPLHPASTTKIMTGYLVAKLATADASVWDEVVTFSARADKTVGSTSGLKAGEKVSVRELLYGLLLPSGNDASVALAEHFGARVSGGDCLPNSEGNFQAFVDGMNSEASRLGMRETHFTNTHGLTNDKHLSSVRDLLKLAYSAMQIPEFAKYTSTAQRGCTVESESGYRRNVVWKNTNRLLGIEGFDGLKTGTTNAAGACLVSRGQRGEHSLLMVVLGASSSASRYTDSKNLYRWGWNEAIK